ncbi:MAG: glycosyltransferase family 4 protein [Leptothrix sp. (in: b-proteobacteria)]
MTAPLQQPALVFSNHGLRPSGGIERYALTLVRGLHERGLHPIFVAKRFDRSLPEYAWVDPIEVPVGLVPGKLRDLWFDWRLRQLKRRHGWFPLIALNQTGAADIAICGSNHPAHLEAMGLPTRRADRWKIDLERRHLENSCIIVAHSQLLAQQVQQHYGIAADKIRLAYPPVDTQRFHPVDAERRAQLRQQFGFPDDRAVFLLASTGHARKGLDLAVQALGHGSKPALLVVAGRPPGITAPNLRYLGYRTDIEDVYRTVDCTLVASRYEPFGLVGIESVLCGTPIIAAQQVGCAEVISANAALRFEIDQPGSLDAAIDQILARWFNHTARLPENHSELRYDPSVQNHLTTLLALRDEVAGLHLA